MELSDHLRAMLKELGQAINESISGSGRVHDSIQKIRDEGYNLYMVLDAKVGVNKREGKSRSRRARRRLGGARGGRLDGRRARRVPHQPEGPALPEVPRHRSHAQGAHPQGPRPQVREVTRDRGPPSGPDCPARMPTRRSSPRHRLARMGEPDPLGLSPSAWEAYAARRRTAARTAGGRSSTRSTAGRCATTRAATELPGALRERLSRGDADPACPRSRGEKSRPTAASSSGCVSPTARLIEAVFMPGDERTARVNEFADARARLRTPGPEQSGKPGRRRSTPPADTLHRLPLLADRLRRGLRLLRHRPARRRDGT